MPKEPKSKEKEKAPVKFTHGGARPGAGRKPTGMARATYVLNLTPATVQAAKKLRKGLNLSAKLDSLLAKWVERGGID